MKGICKSFPGVKALDEAELKVKAGSVHALMGENGAGKSTLMKCLFGIYKKDGGSIYLNGRVIEIKGINEALNYGISMVHQELQPILDRSIGENIFCGRYPLKKIGAIKIIDHFKMNELTNTYLHEVGLNIDSKTKCLDLSVSQMQSVEIAKAISLNAKIVIMDEPTSSLTEKEVDSLFEIIKKLKSKGCSIIYISHKMEEILRISDEVTIMRDGKYVGTWISSELTTNMIIQKMVGRELTNRYPLVNDCGNEVILKVEDYTSIHPKSFKDINFELKKGEILGIGGLVGSQRSELMEAIFGLRNIKKGKIYYKNEQLFIKNPSDAIKKGIALLTEDRRLSGIFGVLSVSDNVSIASLDKYLNFHLIINRKKLDSIIYQNINKMNIKTPSIKTPIQSLSGGNQQRSSLVVG